MSTFRELISMVIDELSLTSDDARFTEHHIAYMLSKYRSTIIAKRYEKDPTPPGAENYSELCIPVESFSPKRCSSGKYLKSTMPIPGFISNGNLTARLGNNPFADNVEVVPFSRFDSSGSGKFGGGKAYASIGGDMHLYVKSSSDLSYVDKVYVRGIVSDAYKIKDFICKDSASDDGNICDEYDIRMPIEDSLISTLIDAVIQHFMRVIDMPMDTENNAADDNSLATVKAAIDRNKRMAQMAGVRPNASMATKDEQ